MTEQEAKSRAERIACLVFQPGKPENEFLAGVIQRELLGLAQEIGWQKEALDRLTTIMDGMKKKIIYYEQREAEAKELIKDPVAVSHRQA